MKKIHFIVIVLIGFFLIPNSTFACGMTSKKASCKTEMNSENCKMKCCQKKSKNKSEKGCEGKCGKSTCQIQTVSFGAILPNLSETNINYFLISTLKQVFYNHETNISAGFYFIWSPPNIG
jgi:hypothetical protein